MKIKVYGYYEFTDDSCGCNDNHDLSILYEVPKAWRKWDEEKRQEWLDKNYNKIDKAFNQAMCVCHCEGRYDDVEEW